LHSRPRRSTSGPFAFLGSRAMAKDTLYLLQPHFEKDGAERFCPDCAMMEGYLAT